MAGGAEGYEDIRYEKGDGIAKITIDRPEVRNAFRPQTLIEISAALELAREDPEVGVIVLTGEGDRAFCSGGDQTLRGDTGYVAEARSPRSGGSTSPTSRSRCGGCRSRSSRWSPAGRPAAATSSTSVCDLTIAADNARFGQTGPRVGSWDGGFGASLLRDLVGTKKAKEFWLLCRSYDAEEAREMGLVNTVVPLDGSNRRRSPGAARCSPSPPSPCACQGELQRPRGRATPGSSSSPTTPTSSSTGADEAREGREAYKEKRKPDFSKFPRRAR